MTAPTHVIGGIATMAFVSLLVPAYNLNFTHLLIGAIASMLPDIDNPRSFIGRIFFFISTPLDRRYGHRTMTHSFLALFGIAMIVYLLQYLYTHSLSGPISLSSTVMLAYFSHLFFDSMTKQGIQAYYPSRIWGVFPKRASWRIRTGSRIELLYFFIFTGCALVFLPLGQSGVVKTFNRLFNASGVEIRLKEFDVKKQKAALGFTTEQIDSLLKSGAIDPKQAQELNAKLLEVQVQEERFKGDQGIYE
jgi:inner membrane protein